MFQKLTTLNYQTPKLNKQKQTQVLKRNNNVNKQ